MNHNDITAWAAQVSQTAGRGMRPAATPFLGIPGIDQLLTQLAPIVMQNFGGVQSPAMGPFIPRGMDPSTAHRRHMEQQITDIARKAAGVSDARNLGQMGHAMGLGRITGMSAQQLGDTFAGVPGLADIASRIPILNQAMGFGTSMHREIDRNRIAFTGRGRLSPDLAGRLEEEVYAAERSVEFTQGMQDYFFDPKTGAADPTRTYGMRSDEIGKVAGLMLERGGAIRGEDGEIVDRAMLDRDFDAQSQAAVKKNLGVLANVMQIMGSADMDQALEALDDIAGKDWMTRDPQALTRSLREIQVMADTMGVDSSLVMPMLGRASATARAAYGISDVDRDLFGVTGGRLTESVARGQVMTELGMMRSGLTAEQAAAQASAITGVIAQSSAGNQAETAAYLRSIGAIGEEHYDTIMSAMATGDPRDFTAAVRSVSRATGYDIARHAADPGFRDVAREHIGDEEGARYETESRRMFARQLEYDVGDRARNTRMQALGRGIMESGLQTPRVTVEGQLDTMLTAALDTYGDDEGLKRAIEATQQQGGTAAERRRRLQGVLGTQAFASGAGEFGRKQQELRETRRREQFEAGWGGDMEAAAEAAALRRMSSALDEGDKKELDRAARAGDVGAVRDMYERYSEDYGGVLDPEKQAFLDRLKRTEGGTEADGVAATEAASARGLGPGLLEAIKNLAAALALIEAEGFAEETPEEQKKREEAVKAAEAEVEKRMALTDETAGKTRGDTVAERIITEALRTALLGAGKLQAQGFIDAIKAGDVKLEVKDMSPPSTEG